MCTLIGQLQQCLCPIFVSSIIHGRPQVADSAILADSATLAILFANRFRQDRDPSPLTCPHNALTPTRRNAPSAGNSPSRLRARPTPTSALLRLHGHCFHPIIHSAAQHQPALVPRGVSSTLKPERGRGKGRNPLPQTQFLPHLRKFREIARIPPTFTNEKL